MKNKLNEIYGFLSNNRIHNKELQRKYYNSVVSIHKNITDRVISLLYHVANSQSQPRIDLISKFFQFIYQDVDSLASFKKFVKRISGKEAEGYKDLFYGLKKCSGWGDKTSALFIKAVFHLRNDDYCKNCKLWNDAPQSIDMNDRIFLPVDTVIEEIFKKIGFNKTTFIKINNEIDKYYKGTEIEVWDDLWFWGFITQRVIGYGKEKERMFEWNLDKYWSLEHSNKDPFIIKEIEEKSRHFLNILL